MGPFLDLLVGAPWWVLPAVLVIFVAAIVIVALRTTHDADPTARADILRAIGEMIWPWRRRGK